MNQERAQLRTDLCDALETLIGSLSAGGHWHWVEWLQSDLQRLQAGDDTYAVGHLLSAFGGMGSLNDILYVETGETWRLASELDRMLRQDL